MPRAVGTLLSGALRASDIACRFGGEELTLILPGAGRDAVRGRLDGLRAAIMRTRVSCQGEDLPAITASIGVAVAGGQEGATALLARADAALDRAKKAGRNRIVAAEPLVDADCTPCALSYTLLNSVQGAPGRAGGP